MTNDICYSKTQVPFSRLFYQAQELVFIVTFLHYLATRLWSLPGVNKKHDAPSHSPGTVTPLLVFFVLAALPLALQPWNLAFLNLSPQPATRRKRKEKEGMLQVHPHSVRKF